MENPIITEIINTLEMLLKTLKNTPFEQTTNINGNHKIQTPKNKAASYRKEYYQKYNAEKKNEISQQKKIYYQQNRDVIIEKRKKNNVAVSQKV